ncbi:hypothetical protein ELS19_15690 [Halogeometricum borinquense]|uniref:Uncharacterized protein n=1 Tax=Halogeometricum borinquense TaxID=60847 RepID=A0A482TBC6_9EURY|nr:hypothetical protein [Halogeometricum borinquense]RYJ15244.1 hypothetical protein ELS19_15690 [Halogeometricum borinquense]
MSRRVPEFALIIGVFFGLSALVFGLVFQWSLFAIVVVAAVGTYPFVAFGLLRDDDPAAVIPPDWVFFAGVFWGLLGVFGVLVDNVSLSALPFAAAIGLALVLPPAAYAVRHDADVNPLSATQTLALGLIAAASLLLVGLVSGRPILAVIDAVLVAVAAGLYATARGVRFDARTRRNSVAVGAVLGVALIAVGVVRGGRLTDWVLVGSAVTFTPSLYVVLSRRSYR